MRREREKEGSIRRAELNKTLWLIIASKLLSALLPPSSHAHTEGERDRESDGKGVRSDHARSMLALLEGEEWRGLSCCTLLYCAMLYCAVLLRT